MKTLESNRRFVEEYLINIFLAAGCDTPRNLNTIIDYIIEDAEETTSDLEGFRCEGVSDAEISTGFRRFIESINP